jgi:multidrug/hemolysin transport system ATP-binding protein
VDEISFDVEEGTLFAFLGPNGAGKSSTINCICTTSQITNGTAKVAGYDVVKESNKVRANIGTVFQESVLDELLSVRENLETRGSFYKLPEKDLKDRIEEVADSVSITDILDRRYGRLSGGQRRRADMARGLLHRPKVLFLDEPTTGLDPQTRTKVWNTVSDIQRKTGMTVFMTTHYMEEAANADYAAIIDKGRIAAHGTPEELRIKFSSDYLKILPKDINAILKILEDMRIKFTDDKGMLIIKQGSSMEALPLLKRVEPYIDQFEVVRGNMDDVFIAVTGHAIREEGE